jgi:hypothetical protein
VKLRGGETSYIMYNYEVHIWNCCMILILFLVNKKSPTTNVEWSSLDSLEFMLLDPEMQDSEVVSHFQKNSSIDIFMEMLKQLVDEGSDITIN